MGKLHIEFDETSMIQMAMRKLYGESLSISGTFPFMAAWRSWPSFTKLFCCLGSQEVHEAIPNLVKGLTIIVRPFNLDGLA